MLETPSAPGAVVTTISSLPSPASAITVPDPLMSTRIESSRSPVLTCVKTIDPTNVHWTELVPLPLHSAAVSSIRSPGSVMVIDFSPSTVWMSFTLPLAAKRTTDAPLAPSEANRLLFAEATGAAAPTTADAAAATSASRNPEPMSRS